MVMEKARGRTSTRTRGTTDLSGHAAGQPVRSQCEANVTAVVGADHVADAVFGQRARPGVPPYR